MSLSMTETDRQNFLADLHVGVVGIPRSGDKAPLTVPIWYDYEPGGDVWMITGKSSIKGRLLANADRISLCAQTEKPPYSYVSVEGSFVIRPVQEGELLQMAIRYLGEEQGKAYAAGSAEGEGSVVVSMTPDTWFSVDYGKA